MSLLKKILFYLFILIAVIITVPSLWFLYQYFRDPLDAVNTGIIPYSVFSGKKYYQPDQKEMRIFSDVILLTEKGDSIKFSVSAPERADKKLAVIIILGGLEIGRKNLLYVPEHGNNILIAYEYPYSPDYWYESAALVQIPQIRKAVLSVPSEMILVVDWVKTQDWADSSNVSILGYSFGTMFIPVVYRTLAENGISLKPGIMAYGGSNLFKLLDNNLKFLPDWSRSKIAWLAATSIHSIEPSLHLPHLRNEFLIINGKYDELIPKECYEELQRLTPEPKKIVMLETLHMHPDRPEIAEQIIEISKKWLEEKKVISRDE